MPTFDISKLDFPRFAGTFFSGLFKRYGEAWYDRLKELPSFRKLQEQNSVFKHGIEAGLYAFTGILDQTVGEDAFLKKFFKEIGMDFGSEFSKRMINGEHIKEILVRNPDHWKTSEEKELISIFADMEDEDLVALLKWANETTAKERKQDIVNMRKMTAEQIIKRSRNPALFKNLMEYFRDSQKGYFLPEINAALRRSNTELEARIAARKGGKANG
jgi:hypothetical protein